MNAKDLSQLKEKLFAQLGSANPQMRRDAFTQMLQQYRVISERLSPQDSKKLMASLLREPDADSLRQAALAVSMIALEAAMRAGGATGARGVGGAPDVRKARPEMLLGDWLFHPFKAESAVFCAADPDFHRRDEYAVIEIARRLSRDDFPRTDVRYFDTSQEEAQSALTKPLYKAIWVMGRPGLLGDPFLRQIRYDKRPMVDKRGKPARFGFDAHRRSEDSQRSAIDARYNYIVEWHGDGTHSHHPTTEGASVREDFGLVQRYPVDVGGRRLTAVICAGASSLGTLAAAIWASEMLFRIPSTTGPDDMTAIPKKKRFGPASRMEALVHATANRRLPNWQAPTIELVKLFVDDVEWSPARARWVIAAPDLITLVRRQGKVAEVLFDSVHVPFRDDRNMFALTVALAEARLDGQSQLSIDELRSNTKLWAGEDVKDSDVRQALKRLRKRYLDEALQLVGDTASLECKVNCLDKS
jgi:hypothetical protein